MMIPPPSVDARDRDALERDLRALIPGYAPAWRLGEAGPGRALVEAFLLFQREVLARLNRVPEKLFLDFLDRLGVNRGAARPARVPVAFALVPGTAGDVVIPAGTPVAAGEVVFETERAFAAAASALKAVFSVHPDEDAILDHAGIAGRAGSAVLFTASEAQPDLQEHSLYLGDADLFNVTETVTLRLAVRASASPDLLASPAVRWEWWGKPETSPPAPAERWNAFEAAWDGGAIRLTKRERGEIAELALGGRKDLTCRWIRCRLVAWPRPAGAAGPAEPPDGESPHAGSPLARLRVESLGAAPAEMTVVPDAAFANDIPCPLPPDAGKPILPFGLRPRQGDAFYLASQEAFSKKGARIAIRLAASPTPADRLPIGRIQGVGKNFQDRLAAAGIRTAGDLLSRSDDEVARAIRNVEKNIPAERYRLRVANIKEAAAKQFLDKRTPPDEPAAAKPPETTSPLPEPRLSWEYWNGTGWVAIPGVVDATRNFLVSQFATFEVPPDLEATKVGGQESRWIRVRIASGDYGQETFTFDGKTWVAHTESICAPRLPAVTLTYAVPGSRPPARLATLNNLQLAEAASDRPFLPFVPIEESAPALYLGFEASLRNGPFSLLVALREREVPESARPRMAWTYSRPDPARPWGDLDPDDETDGLIRNGLVSFRGPTDGLPAVRFGRELFWIRIADRDRRYVDAPAPGSSGPPPAAAPDPRIPCPDAVAVFRDLVPAAPGETAPRPELIGIYPNAVWAVQAESLWDEGLGGSDGTAGQEFRLARAPIVSASVWVDEQSALTREESDLLAADPARVREEKDPAGQRTAFWVRWEPVDDLDVAGAGDRVFLLDRVQGRIRFGDGARGRIPPAGRGNLKADYQVGGGGAGNVPAGAIRTLRSGLAGVESVTNPLAAGGGADPEAVPALIERGPQVLKHRGRAVTPSDYEWLAREASSSVVRVRCLPRRDDRGEIQPGWVTLVIVPQGDEARPSPSPALKAQVRAYVGARAPRVVSGLDRLVVAGPVYVHVSVSVDLIAASPDVAARLEGEGRARLAAFLHPLTGGPEGTGWSFGQIPSLSDIEALLQQIDGVDHLDRLSVQVEEPTSGKSLRLEESVAAARWPSPYVLVSCGDPRIRLIGIASHARTGSPA
jgi:predicted flap endonuclease-1-like 5' DNA nuclease